MKYAALGQQASPPSRCEGATSSRRAPSATGDEPSKRTKSGYLQHEKKCRYYASARRLVGYAGALHFYTPCLALGCGIIVGELFAWILWLGAGRSLGVCSRRVQRIRGFCDPG